MRTRRFWGFVLMAALAIGAMSAFSFRAFAQQLVCVETGENGSECSDTDAPEAEGKADGLDGSAAAPAGVAITADKARAIAEAAYPGAKAREVEFEREGGVQSWEVELDNGLEVNVSPDTGEILSAGPGD